MVNLEQPDQLADYQELKPPAWFFSPHIETIIPSLVRKTGYLKLHRERLEIPDGDFLDLDWHLNRGDQLVILSHGLEGSSRRPYMIGMMDQLGKAGYDCLAWNCRSCSEELNRLPRLYHHADHEDLGSVIDHALEKGYNRINLVGFSMGGNLSLHWVHANLTKAREVIDKAIVISAPVDLKASALHLMKRGNFLYKNRFLKKLKQKLQEKQKQFPNEFSLTPLKEIDSFYKLDEYYTAPIHGFTGAEDFYHKGSTYYKLKDINVPTLLLQARNDPFFPGSCYPDPNEIKNTNLTFLYPKFGGHVGFTKKHNKEYYSEEIAVRFLGS